MAAEQDDVLAAIEEHTKAVDGSLGGMKKTIEGLQKQLGDEGKYREELERKLNLLRVTGAGATSDSNTPDARETFARAVKSWHPGRESIAQDFDYDTYRKAFNKYVRQGIEVLSPDERKAMSVGVDPEGGYLAPSELVREIIRVERENSVIRSIARILPLGAGDVEFPASLTRPAVGWVGETGARTATDAPGLGKFRLDSKEIYAMPEATQKIIDDSVFDIEQFLGEEIGLAIAEEEDAKFIAGDGVVAPRGFTTYPTAAVADSAGSRAFGTIEHIATGQAGAWPTTMPAIYDKLVDVVQALRPRYRQRAEWVMGTEAITKLRKMKTTTTDEPIWQPSITEGQPDRLLGYPVREAEQMPAVGANSLSVAFADWRRAYWIGDRFGIRVLRDPYTNKPYVRFYTTKRVAGGVADSSAIKLLKFAAT